MMESDNSQLKSEAAQAVLRAKSKRLVSVGEEVHEFITEKEAAGAWKTEADKIFLARRKANKMRRINGGRDPR